VIRFPAELLHVIPSKVEKSLTCPQAFAVLVEQIAFDAYNLEAMRTELTQIKNFISGQWVEPIGFLVIPSEVEESLDFSVCTWL